MNVLSLFDGMSCGQIALKNLGIKVDKYFACEIDKHAIEITQHNFPETIQLGDVTKVKATDLPKIDLVIGGSPCQGFSFNGKQLNFNDPRSALFFEFERLVKEINPKYFFLENVKMKQEYEDVITEHMGVRPIKINSSLMSAQSRERLYWTNIPNIEVPKDKGIMLRDILEPDTENTPPLQPIKDEWKPQISTNYIQWDKNNTGHKSQHSRAYYERAKHGALTTNSSPKVIPFSYFGGLQFRDLTMVEAERLQTVPDNYTNCVSNTRRIHALGNGWTVDVITHCFKNMEFN